ncbi:MAG: cysteine desulfuration protein SufE [Candidatus Marinimicrobia bacterium]|nr:cysteine desulfuration protein SufE [Candidatus Neomarinimicrobiota bacterium]
MLKEEFDILDNPMDKYQYLIDMAKDSSATDSIRMEENLIKGCVSQAWMKVDFLNNGIRLVTDSDALIVKGLLSILEKITKGINNNEINKIDGSQILNDLGLGYSISSQRTNGFIGAVSKLKGLLNK